MLRPATTDDLEQMRAWRNHPRVRAVSLTQHEISAEEHAAWWERASQDTTRRVLVFERNGTAAGVVTFFDIEGSSASWGFYLDLDGLESRGETLPAWTSIGREAVKFAVNSLGTRRLRGEVLSTNEAVRRMNSLWGFTESGPRTEIVDGAERLVYDLELVVDDSGKVVRSSV